MDPRTGKKPKKTEKKQAQKTSTVKREETKTAPKKK